MKITKIYEGFGTLSSKTIEEFESRYTLRLPKDYRDFLVNNNGGRVIPNVFMSRNGEISSDIQFLFGFTEHTNYDIEQVKLAFKNRIPENILPIACDSGGNIIGVGVGKDNYNQIMFWSHDAGELKKDLFYLSGSFKEFMGSLFEPEKDFSEFDIALNIQNVKYFRRILNELGDINLITNEYDQPLAEIAALKNKVNVLEFCISNNASSEGLMVIASKTGSIDAVRFLLECNVSPNQKENKANFDSALIKASALNHIDVVRLLLSHGADPNICNRHNFTALQKAKSMNYDDIVELLKCYGAEE
ncbi:SMI1/KNR4 family protein [Carboxylicivirga linearis]|uniref:SMI1/KNR4 family protein n=1 Tax=Carboxylicivirga linearis TaxID=1628157 RepID=A0ABS5JYY5_9BACT|nr:SMI1/KNR4 family protein [Carboxylicivirga linearis]MBS2100117.1 SMI1/KNR4 family protein [Carboxylicivirga linearis]